MRQTQTLRILTSLRHGTSTLDDLWRNLRIYVAYGSISTVLNQASKKGLVTRNATRRPYEWSLTERGREWVANRLTHP